VKGKTAILSAHAEVAKATMLAKAAEERRRRRMQCRAA